MMVDALSSSNIQCSDADAGLPSLFMAASWSLAIGRVSSTRRVKGEKTSGLGEEKVRGVNEWLKAKPTGSKFARMHCVVTELTVAVYSSLDFISPYIRA